MGDHLLLIDLSAIYWPAWHAIPPSEGADAPHRVTVDTVRRLAAAHGGPVAVCCDSPGRGWRHDLAASYKANREAKPPEVIAQLRRCAETLRLDGYAVWQVASFEADDIIATACRLARAAGHRVTIATEDKDLLQLVGPSVACHRLRDGAAIGEPEVVAKFGVRPTRIGDWLALVGDTSDNVSGVPGIGPKGATKLLTQWGSLASLMVAVEEGDERIPATVRAKLLEHSAALGVSRQLVSLRDDVPIDFDAAFAPRVAQPLPAPDFGREEDRMGEGLDDVARMGAEDDGGEHDGPPEVTGEPVAPAAPSEPARVVRSGDVVTMGDAPRPTTALALRPGSDEWALALEPQSLSAARALALDLHNSRLFAKFPTPQAALAAVMLGRTLGIPSVTFVQQVHVLEDGKLTLPANLITGLVIKSRKADLLKCIETSATSCTWVAHRRDDADPTPTRITWTIEDARRAGLMSKKDGTEKTGSNWHKYPAQMLRKQAGVDICRLVFPDVAGGLYSVEELDSDRAQIDGGS